MRNLIRFFSYHSFVVSANAVGLLLVWALLRDGVQAPDGALLLAYVVGAGLLGLWLRTPRQKITRFDALAAFDRALHEGRPTLLEFYSDNCAGCMLMRPVLDRIERESGYRLQLLRVDVTDEIGKALADRYAVTLTPTFILFDGSGGIQQEFLLALDRARVLYWLNQQAPAG